MARTAQQSHTDVFHPIDLVETVAAGNSWIFERITEDQIAVIAEGQWQNYSISLAWSNTLECLQFICAFDMAPPDEVLPNLNAVLNLVNASEMFGGFSYWADSNLITFQYSLLLSGGAIASSEQINQMVKSGLSACEKYYPVFQLVGWANETPEKAIKVAFGAITGRA